MISFEEYEKILKKNADNNNIIFTTNSKKQSHTYINKKEIKTENENILTKDEEYALTTMLIKNN